MRTTLRLLAAAALAVPLALTAADAAGGKTKELKHVNWSWTGFAGGYDQLQLQRGYQVYREVCASCHGLDLVAFRHLGEDGGPYHLDECPEELGLPASTDCSIPASNPFVKAIAADYQIDTIDDVGDVVQRPGIPADYHPAPYANKQQAIAANGGAYPPDQSLIAKARPHGPEYIYSLLTGYVGLPNGPAELPEMLEIPAGQYYNPFYPGDTASLVKDEFMDEEGHLIGGGELPYGGAFKMAPPIIADCQVTYEDGSDCSIDALAKDVTAFLMWSAEPKLEQRKAMGQFVLIYLLVFAGILYASYRQIWRNVAH